MTLAFTRRCFGFLTLVVLTASLAGCFESEPDQRKAFIAFLQTRIVDRAGVHVPKLNDADTAAFGGYVQHYQVITGFTNDADLTAMSQKMAQALPSLRSAQGLIEQRVGVRKAASEMGDVLRTMEEKFKKTKAARDALSQPGDLKTVFDKAFEKTVVAPVEGFRETAPLAQGIALAAADLGDYVALHSDSVKFVGTSLQGKDRKTQSEVDTLLNALNSKGPKFNDAQRRLRIVLQGS